MRRLIEMLDRLGLSSDSSCRAGFVAKMGALLGVTATLILFFGRI